MASKLHQQQLTRAIKRVILGLGAVPSAPRSLRCRPVSCRAVACAWDPPTEPGHPPFHKFKLERLRQARRQVSWNPAAEVCLCGGCMHVLIGCVRPNSRAPRLFTGASWSDLCSAGQ